MIKLIANCSLFNIGAIILRPDKYNNGIILACFGIVRIPCFIAVKYCFYRKKVLSLFDISVKNSLWSNFGNNVGI